MSPLWRICTRRFHYWSPSSWTAISPGTDPLTFKSRPFVHKLKLGRWTGLTPGEFSDVVQLDAVRVKLCVALRHPPLQNPLVVTNGKRKESHSERLLYSSRQCSDLTPLDYFEMGLANRVQHILGSVQFMGQTHFASTSSTTHNCVRLPANSRDFLLFASVRIGCNFY